MNDWKVCDGSRIPGRSSCNVSSDGSGRSYDGLCPADPGSVGGPIPESASSTPARSSAARSGPSSPNSAAAGPATADGAVQQQPGGFGRRHDAEAQSQTSRLQNLEL